MNIHHSIKLQPWSKAKIAIASVFIILISGYWETLSEIITLWSESETYGHGFLLIPISAYLVWRERSHLAQMIPAPEVMGVIFVALLSSGWIFGDLVNVLVVKQVSLFLLIPACVWALFGRRITRHLAFPLLYPLLAVPIWSPLTTVLQVTTARVSARLLEYVGVPVYLDGYYLSIPEGRFVIAEVCAGLNYFMATLAITSLYAHLNYRRLNHALFFVSMGVCFSLLLNWVRVVIIIMIGHIASMQHPLIDNHRELGWVLFALSLPVLLVIGALIRSRTEYRRDNCVSEQLTNNLPNPGSKRSGFPMITAGVGLALLLGPAGANWAHQPSESAANVSFVPPLIPGSWAQMPSGSSDWKPKFVGADAELLTNYEKAGRRVELYLAYYEKEKQNKEVINELNSVYSIELDAAVKVEKLTISTRGWRELDVWQTRLTLRDESTRLIWHWYYVDGKFIANPYAMKLLQVWALLGKRPGAAVVAVATDYSSIEQTDHGILRDFLEHSLPVLQVMLENAPD